MVERVLTQPVPNLSSPMVNVIVNVNGRKLEGKGFLISPWNSFFQQFAQQAPDVIETELTGSPFSITFNANGTYIVTGGIISAITLTRGSVAIDLTGQVIIPIRIGDMLTVTYSVVPTLQFLPN